MKQFIILLLTIFSFSIHAQTNNWFMEGQQWHYSYNASFESGYEKLTVIGDTIIENKNCKKLETIKTVHDIGFAIYTTNPSYQYTYEENDSVYCQFQGEFHLIYDFNMQIEDRMMFSGDLAAMPDSIGYEIDSIGTMDIGGTPLKFQKVSILRANFDGTSYEIVGESYIIETIGMTALEDDNLRIGYFNLMRGFGTLGLIEESWSFRCFSNIGIIFQPHGDWCDKLNYGNWLNPGASWCYTNYQLGNPIETNIRLQGVEIHETHNPPLLWKAYKERRYAYLNSVSTSIDSFYLHEVNGILYQVPLDLSESRELINLNWQTNDTIQFPNDLCLESYLAIDSTKNIQVDGELLRRLYCTKYLDSENWGLNSMPYIENIEITERIGSFSLFIPDYFTCIVGDFNSSLRNYSDNDINYTETGNGNCFNINVSNNEMINHHTSISPNPANSTIRIESDETIKEINIFNYSGQFVQTIKNDFEKIDISNLSKGLYLIELKLDNEQILYERMIKH